MPLNRFQTSAPQRGLADVTVRHAARLEQMKLEAAHAIGRSLADARARRQVNTTACAARLTSRTQKEPAGRLKDDPSAAAAAGD